MKYMIIKIQTILVFTICVLMLSGTNTFAQPGKSKGKAPKDTTQIIKENKKEIRRFTVRNSRKRFSV